jgi:hypothetical protein
MEQARQTRTIKDWNFIRELILPYLDRQITAGARGLYIKVIDLRGSRAALPHLRFSQTSSDDSS